MSYHIVSIDAPDCSLSCKDGQNQFSLAAELAPDDERLPRLGQLARSRAPSKEAECAKLFWRIYADHVAVPGQSPSLDFRICDG